MRTLPERFSPSCDTVVPSPTCEGRRRGGAWRGQKPVMRVEHIQGHAAEIARTQRTRRAHQRNMALRIPWLLGDRIRGSREDEQLHRRLRRWFQRDPVLRIARMPDAEAKAQDRRLNDRSAFDKLGRRHWPLPAQKKSLMIKSCRAVVAQMAPNPRPALTAQSVRSVGNPCSDPGTRNQRPKGLSTGFPPSPRSQRTSRCRTPRKNQNPNGEKSLG